MENGLEHPLACRYGNTTTTTYTIRQPSDYAFGIEVRSYHFDPNMQ